MAFMDTIIGAVKNTATDTGGWLLHYGGAALALPFKAAGLVDDEGNLIGAADLIDQALGTPDLPPTVRDSLQRFAANKGLISQVVGGLSSAIIVAAGMIAEIRPILSIAEQSANADVRPELLTVEQLMALFRRRLETEGNIDAELRAIGLRDTDIANLKALTVEPLDTDAIRNLLWRGVITQTTAGDLLSKIGYDENQQQQLFQLFSALPTVDDHLRMANRQVFNPEIRQALGLDEDYPETLTPLIAMVGLSEYWAKNIWAAHWEIPSPTQLFEMRFRGAIDDTLLHQALRDAGYSPLWRDKLLQINQRLVTRVDGRRLFDTGIWDEARLQRHFEQLGYAEQDAKDLATWTVRNATEGDQLRKSRVKAMTEQMIVRALETYVIHSDTAREMLQGLNYTAEEIELIVGAAEFARDRALTTEIETAVKHNYVRGQMSRDDAITQLRGIALDDDRITRLLIGWDLLAQSTYLTEHAHHTREVTKADLVSAYEDAVMPRDQLRAMLLEIGYPANEVDLLIANADTKIAKAAKRDAIETVHFQYVNGQIDEHTAGIQLDAMNLRAGERAYLLAKWTHEAHRGTTNLTFKEVGDLFGARVINKAQVQAELSALGFSAQHVNLLGQLIYGGVNVDAQGYLVRPG